MIQYDASWYMATSTGSLLKSRVGHACAEVYKSLTSQMMWLPFFVSPIILPDILSSLTLSLLVSGQ